MICPATLPQAGTKVDVDGVGTATVLQSTPSALSGLYGGALTSTPLPPGFDNGCTLKIQYADGTTDVVSAAEAPPSAVDEALGVAAIPAYLALQGLPLLFPDSEYDEYDEYESMMGSYEAQRAGSKSKADPPDCLADMNGEYWGGSEESDEGDQAIRVHFKFSKDGKITGRGRDNVDGSYKIPSGYWKARPDGDISLHWKEDYDEGFDVICEGTYHVKSGKVVARFASSRGVSGSFELAKKPSIF